MPRHLHSQDRGEEARRLFELRKALGLSQREMAEEFQVAGGAIAQWESGARTLPGPVLRLIDLYEAELIEAPGPAVQHVSPALGWLPRTGSAGAALAAWVFARSLLPTSTDSTLVQRIRGRSMQRYVLTASRLKGLAMKWAQLAWVLDGLLEEDERAALSLLRDAPPALSPGRAAAVFFEDLGEVPRRCFASWSPVPFASGSVGQVHAAALPTGQTVAVKIQYPGAEALLKTDLRNIGVLDSLSRLFLRAQRPDVLHQEMRQRFLEECDYQLEAANQCEVRRWFADRCDIHVPAVLTELSRRRVLTMEHVEGSTLEEFAAQATQAERDHAGEAIWTFYYRSIFAHGAYNTDPHPGNFLFNPGRVTFLDFGRIKRLSGEYVRLWHRLGRALFARDTATIERVLVELGYVPDPAGFDFRPIRRLLHLWMLPCLTQTAFTFTPAYLRELATAYLSDPTRAQVSFSADMVFLPQLLFGVAGILTKLRATVRCCYEARLLMEA
jgi:predicted unusual protein kinase regulating ubiquinone biosynthesis (AarF/ABC1/UbiB family)